MILVCLRSSAVRERISPVGGPSQNRLVSFGQALLLQRG